MPTQSERKALVFLGAVACLGGGVRVIRAHEPPPPVSVRRALDAQISQAVGQAPPPSRPKPVVTVRAVVAPPPGPFNRVDVDRASAQELQALPGIGPALARRIVAYRDSAGAFGGPERFGRVKGIGPATLKRLDSLITFSGVVRP